MCIYNRNYGLVERLLNVVNFRNLLEPCLDYFDGLNVNVFIHKVLKIKLLGPPPPKKKNKQHNFSPLINTLTCYLNSTVYVLNKIW